MSDKDPEEDFCAECLLQSIYGGANILDPRMKANHLPIPDLNVAEDSDEAIVLDDKDIERVLSYPIRKLKKKRCCKCKKAKPTGKAPLIRMKNGRDIPSFGLGTYLGKTVEEEDKSMEDAVKWAIEAGYRLIDTASIYNTEDQVGRGIAAAIDDGTLKSRNELFVVTKLWNDAHEPKNVVPALRESLRRLNLTYVDLYLMHWPIAQYNDGTYYDTDYVDTWKALLEARDQGLTRSVGVSNFNIQQLERLMSLTPEKPAVNQVEINLNLQQPQLLDFCKKNNITIMGYTPFGSLLPDKANEHAPPPRITDPALVRIANNHNKTVTQITLRYIVELGVIPIPKSVTKSRIEQNIEVFDFALLPEDKNKLKTYDRGYRTIAPTFWHDAKDYPFKEK